ncbi:hypothetical protein [Collimonas humicola]|uniref:hypothetical protein n=1 Tax=Collimonas humicola TaxID=2825886 RepID=UPI001B8D5D8F|nr:hypothetical protein [Collimonas humicola]
MISVKQAITFSEIEDLYEVIDTPEAGLLRIPTSLKYGGGFGVPVSLVQYLANWSRQLFPPTLKLYPSPNTDVSLKALAQEPHGMAALYFAPSLLDSTNQKLASRDGLRFVIPYIQAMQASSYRETMHGRGVFLACFSAAKNEYLLPLYSKGRVGTLRRREDFITLTEQIIVACAPSAKRALTNRRLSSIANLLYELFRNTDEHAQTDEIGNSYTRNIRGIMAKFVSINDSNARTASDVHDVSQNLFMLRNIANKRLFPDEEGRGRASAETYFLELTVFDTGPGLVRRWISKNSHGTSIEQLSIEEEVNFVKKCFEQHASTKDSQGSGHGLDLVIGVLAELNAFLKLRTGRVCLVQDFSALRSKKFDPRHWMKDRPELALAAGAAYSIIIPLSRGDT